MPIELIPFCPRFHGGPGASRFGQFFPPASPEKVLQELLLILYSLPVFPGRVLFYNTRINITTLNLYSQRVGSSILLQNASREMVGG